MTDETILPEETEENMLKNSDGRKKIHISAFTIIDNDDGIQIKISNKTELHVYDKLPNYIIGTVKIDDQIIPVIDLKAKKGSPLQKIDKNSCIILQQHTDGKYTVTTGALYEDVTAVLEIISRKL
jgi:chemotaxis signal transduction protein